MNEWRWRVTLRYRKGAKWPKRAGDVAIQVLHKTDSGKDMEVQAAEKRADVEIEVERLS